MTLRAFLVFTAVSACVQFAVANDFVACTALKADKARLACFDNAAAALKQKQAAKSDADSKHQHELAPTIAAIERYKEILVRDFKDPDAVKFRNIVAFGERHGQIGILCGEANAKNSYGAYTGFKRFYFIGGLNKPSLEDDANHSVFERNWVNKCNVTESFRELYRQDGKPLRPTALEINTAPKDCKELVTLQDGTYGCQE